MGRGLYEPLITEVIQAQLRERHAPGESVTCADSDTGQRYQQHASRGSTIQLFARRRSDERAFTFLGPATYVKHESERPMAVTWRLHHPLPGDLFASFAAAVA
ncbi:MAG: DUF3427 domain-containing protein [Myxococcaceae bacterium]|nr:MAG: DUF3427 domain-containing protein [Myxococcaceae bacterium]